MRLRKRLIPILFLAVIGLMLSAKKSDTADNRIRTTVLPAPQNVSATDSVYYDRIEVEWEGPWERLNYKVLIYDLDQDLIDSTKWALCRYKKCSIVIGNRKSMKQGKTYYFAVQAGTKSNNTSAISEKDKGTMRQRAAPNVEVKDELTEKGVGKGKN